MVDRRVIEGKHYHAYTHEEVFVLSWQYGHGQECCSVWSPDVTGDGQGGGSRLESEFIVGGAVPSGFTIFGPLVLFVEGTYLIAFVDLAYRDLAYRDLAYRDLAYRDLVHRDARFLYIYDTGARRWIDKVELPPGLCKISEVVQIGDGPLVLINGYSFNSIRKLTSVALFTMNIRTGELWEWTDVIAPAVFQVTVCYLPLEDMVILMYQRYDHFGSSKEVLLCVNTQASGGCLPKKWNALTMPNADDLTGCLLTPLGNSRMCLICHPWYWILDVLLDRALTSSARGTIPAGYELLKTARPCSLDILVESAGIFEAPCLLLRRLRDGQGLHGNSTTPGRYGCPLALAFLLPSMSELAWTADLLEKVISKTLLNILSFLPAGQAELQVRRLAEAPLHQLTPTADATESAVS
ncbi:hypothetical protein GNI_050330 [Gregarina niphandrodes]|uniref:Uncharacterized protein n=1 Tax=Gregarina niphandrodes TaxID=110365 RepID=A0A023B9D6_GRENI|nr:hypothetical protein GNI_050330 [Gregarina niphandrodes]EZG72874.1 hypothetical protein GNI_050330 [Gregarina niphandrodes]|eukprot:XP_011129733.1 hypothetical protein GNI_050330 [Gregarina niphandrodes]